MQSIAADIRSISQALPGSSLPSSTLNSGDHISFLDLTHAIGAFVCDSSNHDEVVEHPQVLDDFLDKIAFLVLPKMTELADIFAEFSSSTSPSFKTDLALMRAKTSLQSLKELVIGMSYTVSSWLGCFRVLSPRQLEILRLAAPNISSSSSESSDSDATGEFTLEQQQQHLPPSTLLLSSDITDKVLDIFITGGIYAKAVDATKRSKRILVPTVPEDSVPLPWFEMCGCIIPPIAALFAIHEDVEGANLIFARSWESTVVSSSSALFHTLVDGIKALSASGIASQLDTGLDMSGMLLLSSALTCAPLRKKWGASKEMLFQALSMLFTLPCEEFAEFLWMLIDQEDNNINNMFVDLLAADENAVKLIFLTADWIVETSGSTDDVDRIIDRIFRSPALCFAPSSCYASSYALETESRSESSSSSRNSEPLQEDNCAPRPPAARAKPTERSVAFLNSEIRALHDPLDPRTKKRFIGHVPLVCIIRWADLGKIRFLLDLGADVNGMPLLIGGIPIPVWRFETTLMQVCRRDEEGEGDSWRELTKLLIEYGADLTRFRDDDSNTALDVLMDHMTFDTSDDIDFLRFVYNEDPENFYFNFRILEDCAALYAPINLEFWNFWLTEVEGSPECSVKELRGLIEKIQGPRKKRPHPANSPQKIEKLVKIISEKIEQMAGDDDEEGEEDDEETPANKRHDDSRRRQREE